MNPETTIGAPVAFLLTRQNGSLDRVNFIPAEMEAFGDRFLAGGQQPVNRQALEQGREPAPWLGPRQFHRFDTVIRTVAARWLSLQNRP